jgi:uncharacterized protein (DUF952 family)
LCFEQNETTNVYNSDPQMSFPHFFTYLSLRTCIDKGFFSRSRNDFSFNFGHEM